MKKILSMLLVLTMFTSMFASTAFAVTDSSFDRQTIRLNVQDELREQATRSLMPIKFEFEDENLIMRISTTVGTKGEAEFQIRISGEYDAQYDQILRLQVDADRISSRNLESWKLVNCAYDYTGSWLNVQVEIEAEFDYTDTQNNHYERTETKEEIFRIPDPFND